MSKRPIVSVIMTIFNHDSYLKKSIISLQKQSLKNWELIAIDNGSTDESTRILKLFKDRRIKKKFLKKNIGRTKCLNYGLKFAKAKYIAILDSDDIALKNRFLDQVNYLKTNKKINLVAAIARVIDENGKTITFHPSPKEIKDFNNIIIYKNIIAHSTVMFRKNYLKKIGIYPKNLKWAQDYGLILKFAKNESLFFMPKVLTICRALKTSMTYRKEYRLTRVKEQISLLFFSLNNFKLNSYQKYKIFLRIIINNIKFFFIRAFGV